MLQAIKSACLTANLLLLAILPGLSAEISMTLNRSDQHQVMDGFGSTQRLFDDPHLFNNFNVATGRAATVLSSAQQDEILRALYTNLGFTRLRAGLDVTALEDQNDNNDPMVADLSRFNFAWKANDGYVDYAKRAMSFGLAKSWRYGATERYMSESNPAEMAEWIMVVLRRWRQLGIEMPYFSVLNEPSWNPGPNGPVSAEYVRQVVLNVGPRMRAEGFSTTLILPDDLNSTRGSTVASHVLSDPQARQYIGVLATHLYQESYGNISKMTALSRQYGMPLWMTEYSLQELMNDGQSSGNPLDWAMLMHDLIAVYDVSAVDYMWGFFGDWERRTQLIVLNTSGTSYAGYTLTKEYFITGQYSRFVRPGFRRVGINSSDSRVRISAFTRDNNVVIVAVNTSASTLDVGISASDRSSFNNASAFYTGLGASENWLNRPVSVSGASLVASLSPSSVTTFVATMGGTSNQPPTVALSTNGTSFVAPANITLNAIASDSDGTITKVEFYQGSALIGTEASSPYSFAWNNVAAGSYSLTAKATDNAGAMATSNAVNITVNNQTQTQTPYSGSPMAIPGTILTAQYDNGGEGIAYHDTDSANLASNSYRPGQAVDSTGSGIGWIVGSEWLEYTVNVSTAGSHTISIPVSQVAGGGTMHVSFNGVNVTGSLSVPNTGNWGAYQNVTATMNLSAGTQVMMVAFDANGTNGYGPGLGDIAISGSGGGGGGGGGPQTAYNGSPMTVPGSINVAQYDNGGEGIAYHDVDAVNYASGTYRPGQGVDSSGSGVGWIVGSEWLEYSVNVSAAGSYTITIPVSQVASGATMHVSFNGTNVTGSMSIPNTGNWGVSQNITATMNLNAGTQIMQVVFDTNGSNGYGPGLGDITIIGSGGGGGTFGHGTGLSGQYFDNADFTGTTFARTDSTVNFDWGMGAPTSSMGVDYFSVRWTGQIEAQNTQAHTFYVTGDDGVRLWINGTLLIDKWILQAPTEYAANMNLTAGTKYDIKLEYFENYGGAVAQLRWSSASTPKQIIPASQLYPTSGAVGSQNPYAGTPMMIPGTISVPRYDTGGEGVAYHDLDASNLMSGTWRPGEAVDTDSNHGIGWIQAGEWIEYTVSVSAAGAYTLSLPTCHPGPGGTFHVNFNGVNKTGTMTVPNTGSWDANQTISKLVSLNAGTQIVQILFDTNGSTGYVCGIGDITLASTPTGNG